MLVAWQPCIAVVRRFLQDVTAPLLVTVTVRPGSPKEAGARVGTQPAVARLSSHRRCHGHSRGQANPGIPGIIQVPSGTGFAFLKRY